MDANRYDAVVVGAGAAGLNAALVLARARRRVAVVDGAAGMGSAAAIALNTGLLHEDVQRALADHRTLAGASAAEPLR